jgi:Peptidase family M1 domain
LSTQAAASIRIERANRPASCTKVATLFIVLALIFVMGRSVGVAQEPVSHQNLSIELDVQGKRLRAFSEITIDKNPTAGLEFRLARRAENLEVTVNSQPRKIDFKDGWLKVRLAESEKDQKIHLTIRYEAVFDDPVPVRPLNAENPGFGVSATISEHGSFLLAGSGWYPQWAGGRSNYTLKVIAPAGMIAVTAGQSKGYLNQNGKTQSTWLIGDPVRGLSLSVGPYIVREKKVGKITAATYFFAETDHLANAYLKATAEYLSMYQNLFGPYPFEKFAVVENFFPTGFGFPSYTLIGGSVLRLPFIIHTSLGHEIAHCWWGNGVLVDDEGGNWSEALTTYVADYFYQEKKSAEDARRYRLQILRSFSTLVTPNKDFALKQFQSRYDPISKTIGYDKGAMIFHMLRKQLGEEAFWGGLRDLYRDRLFKATSWTDLQKEFEIRGGRSLQPFFDQWVFHKGAPRFYLDAIQSKQTGNVWKIEGRIVQSAPPSSFDLNLMLETRDHRIYKTIRVSDKETPIQIMAKSKPIRLVADPDCDVMRRLFPDEIPPAINALKRSAALLAVFSADLKPEVQTAVDTLILSLGIKNYRWVAEEKISREQLNENDLLLVGYPQDKALFGKLPVQVAIHPKSFILNKKTYDQSSDVFFGVFKHPFADDRIAALFFPLAPQQAGAVARKITHYGKYSYLAFQNGQNRDKGLWPIEQSALEYRWSAGTKE